ncbi:MAG: alpha/beta fold hydrolase [Saprospiraceae bacterium]
MHNRIFTLLSGLLLLLTACNSTDETTAVVEVPEYTIEQFMSNTSLGGADISADGSKVMFTSNESGVYNVYEMSADSGAVTALTQSDSAANWGISYFPADDRFLFRMDDNGNEIFHIYARAADGTTKELTPGAEARASFYGWATDGNSFYYGFSQRDPRLMDVYEMQTADYSTTMIYQNDGAYDFNGVSPDGRYIAFSKSITTNDSDLFLYDTESKELKQINENRASHSVADFAPDGSALYYLTDDGSEFKYLVEYNLTSGERKKTLEKDWDIWYTYFSHNGKYRVTGINEDGKTSVSVLETATGKNVDFPAFPNADISGVDISRDESAMTFRVSSSRSPSDLYRYDFGNKDVQRLTNTMNAEINSDDLVESEVVRYKSFDGTVIPAIYYKPKQATAANKVPALVLVHGGPGGQTRQNYRPMVQYLVNHGYAVLGVNNRGSSGYGKTFYKMDDQNHGEADLQDCVEGKNWLAQQDYIDANKIGIIGGSYGGFMTMAAMTSTPEEFAVGVNIFGVTNWLRTLKSIPPWWESFKDALYEEMGDPAVDSVRLYNISPLFHADKIVNPVMVLQGAKDPRVLQVESDEMVEEMKKNNVPVEYVLFEDEGHGFVKKENEIEAYGKILQFLDKHLKNLEVKG